MPFSLKTHEVKTDKRTRVDKIVGVNPYVRICKADQYENSAGKVCYSKTPAIFLQDGGYWYENGDVVKELPDWVPAEIAKISEAQLKAAGFNNSGGNGNARANRKGRKIKAQEKEDEKVEVEERL